MRQPTLTLLAAALLFAGTASGDAHANSDTGRDAAVRVDTDQQAMAEYDQLIKMAVNHPNELYRLYATRAAAQGQWRDAVKHFRTAARYADKYSQHRLSLLYWHGIGVAEDRVESYIWADLAAERGYPKFLAIREKMWRELTPEQQASVPVRGQKLYGEYGDPVAKKRFANALAQGKRKITGSRTGFFNRLYVSTVGTGQQLTGGLGSMNLDRMYEESRTDPQRYWKFEDHVWKTVSVEISDIERAPDEAGPPKSETQPPTTP